MEHTQPLHLSFIPAFRPEPERFSAAECDAMLKFACSVWSGEFFRQGEIDLSKLRRGAFGDLGGAFIINPEADKAGSGDTQLGNRPDE